MTNEIKRKVSFKTLIIDTLSFVMGGLMMGFSVEFFAAPNRISIGGITGIATMLNFITDGKLPIGLTSLAINIPLFVLALIFLGKEMLVKTVIGTICASVSMDLFAQVNMTPYTENVLVAAIFGGVIGGIGLGLIFLRGGTTGGVDIMARLVKLKLPYMEMGKIILVLEGILLIIVTAVYRDISIALYSIITIFTYSKMVDIVLYGMDMGKGFFIISDKNREIAAEIMHRLGRGVTILKGTGAYTNTDKEVILTALRNNETAKVREIVRDIDPDAFIIVCSTSETIGYGFKSIKENK